MNSYNLRSVLELPPLFRSTFSFRFFNSLQSECFPTCFLSDVNMVISAPTGSGKTVLFELCILRLLSRFFSADGRFVHLKGTLKTVYIAPSKALVQEKHRDWTNKFGAWGISCLEMTGDNDSYNTRNIQEADIILTTPEKFDAVTRFRIKDGGLGFFSDIGLLLIDEVHLLNDPRGAALEAIVSRIKMLSCRPELKSSPLANVRFIAVSATIPNLEDLAEWLLVPHQGMKRFGEEMRPVKLTTKVFGYPAAKNDFLFEKRLQNYIFDILMQYSRGKSALVFCSTRKGAQEAAQIISQTAMTFGYSNPFIRTTEQLERLREASLSCSDKQMQSYIPYGVGYHNGGLSLKDRNLVENLFLSGDIQVLCTTNTLAHGVNLPAHTVVIKSTQNYNREKSGYIEYDRSTVLQMCGRAGRPPFDDTGMVIIMTRKETVHLYENLLNGCEIVESQLLSCMTEHLTAEIVQLTVPDITRAIEWMKCSYLYVRMKKNPDTYSVKKGISRDHIERHMQDICVQKVNELSRHQMIWTDEDGFLLKPLEPGSLMTKYYLKFNTMKYIMEAPSYCNLEEALHTVCRAEELSWIQLRRNEKRLLNDINADKNDRLRFHIVGDKGKRMVGDKGKRKKRIQAREEKIFVLSNDCLTGDPLVHDLSLIQDTNSICTNGCRIAKCMKEYFVYRKNYKGAMSSIVLAKSLHHKLWDDSPYLLKQLPGIGMVTAKALLSMGITSFETLAEADPRRIEIVAGRKFPFGDNIKESLLTLPPKVELKVEATESQRQGKPKLAVTLTRLTQSQSSKRHYADLLVGLEEENTIVYHEKIRVNDFLSPYHTTVQLTNHLPGKLIVKADLVFEEFIGIDLHQKLEVAEESQTNVTAKVVRKKPTSLRPAEESQTNVTAKVGRKKPTSSLRPAEVFPVKEISERTALITEQPTQRSFNEAKDDMPSFILLDDELQEVFLPPKIEEDEQMVVSANSIFDHIRRKSKDYPVITTSGAIQFPVSKITKKSFTEQLPLRRVAEVPEQVEGTHNKDERTNCLTSEPGLFGDLVEQEVSKHGMTSTTQHTPNLVNCDDPETAGELKRQIGGKRKELQMIEPNFNQVRKRSKNSPVIIKPDSMGSGSYHEPQDHFFAKDHPQNPLDAVNTRETYSSKPLLASVSNADPESSKNESLLVDTLKNKMRLPSSRSLDLPFDAFNRKLSNTASNDQNTTIHSVLRKDIQFEPPGNSAVSKSRSSPKGFLEANGASCSIESETTNRNDNAFLGYKSVFSFL